MQLRVADEPTAQTYSEQKRVYDPGGYGCCLRNRGERRVESLAGFFYSGILKGALNSEGPLALRPLQPGQMVITFDSPAAAERLGRSRFRVEGPRLQVCFWRRPLAAATIVVAAAAGAAGGGGGIVGVGVVRRLMVSLHTAGLSQVATACA